MSFDWASGCGSRDVTVWLQTRSAERGNPAATLAHTPQGLTPTLGRYITHNYTPPPASVSPELLQRWWNFQKDKITNWKWQLSPPSFIRNRPGVSVPLWALFHIHSVIIERSGEPFSHQTCTLHLQLVHFQIPHAFYCNTSHCGIFSPQLLHATETIHPLERLL